MAKGGHAVGAEDDDEGDEYCKPFGLDPHAEGYWQGSWIGPNVHTPVSCY
jgi:hypothetical protein